MTWSPATGCRLAIGATGTPLAAIWMRARSVREAAASQVPEYDRPSANRTVISPGLGQTCLHVRIHAWPPSARMHVPVPPEPTLTFWRVRGSMFQPQYSVMCTEAGTSLPLTLVSSIRGGRWSGLYGL